MRARRPWLHRHALGAPEVPDVKSRYPRESGVTDGSATSAGTAPAWMASSDWARLRVEDQHPRVVGGHGTEGVADAGTVDEGERGGVGDEELALGVGEVADQLVAAVRGVGPDDDGPRQCRAPEPEDELGNVVEQDGDVERAVGALGVQPGGPGGGPCDHLGVAEPKVCGHEAETCVVGAGEHGAGDRLRGLAPALRQLRSPLLQTSLTWGGIPIIGTRCTLVPTVLPSAERRRNGPRHRRRGRASPWNSASSTAVCVLPRYVERHGASAEHDRIMDEVAYVEAADKAGFKYTWATEHHFLTEYSHLSANESFLALRGRPHQEHPHRVGHLQHHATGEPPGPHRRAGGHARPSLRGPLRVRHRPRLVDDRAARLRDRGPRAHP